MAGDQQVVGGGHPRRPGADDGRSAPGLRLDLERDRWVHALVEHRLEDLVAGVAVGVADRDRLVHLVAPAVLLARCRADPAEDGREGDRPLEDPGRLPEVRLGVRLQEGRDVDVARALVLAGRQAVRVVVGEDQLEVRRSQPADLLCLGLHHHLGFGALGAADRRVRRAFDVDDAHPAGPETRQLRLIAERRDLDPVVTTDLEDRLAVEALDDLAVDLDPDPGRRLGSLRRLGRQQPLGDAVGKRCEFGAMVRAGDQVGHVSQWAAPAATAIGRQTPAGQELRRMWSSSSDRKYRIPLAYGSVARRS